MGIFFLSYCKRTVVGKYANLTTAISACHPMNNGLKSSSTNLLLSMLSSFPAVPKQVEE